MRITRKFIAEKAKVSPTTVSDVLNKNPKARISDTARKRVINAAEKYNYSPNLSARSLVMGKSFNIGLMYKASLLNFLKDPFSQEVFVGIESELEKREYGMLFSLLKSEKPLNNSVKRMLYGNSVDGVLLLGVIDSSIIESLRENGKPFALIDYYIDGQDAFSLMPENIEGAYSATKYLLDNDCQKTICINGEGELYPHPSYHERPQGYIKAMKERQLPIEMIYTLPDIDNSYTTVKKLLENGNIPDAFFATGDHMAIGCLRAIKNFDSSLLDKIRIIGFDNISWSAEETPALSTVNVPKQELGAEAVKLLIQQIAGDKNLTNTRLKTSLVLRAT